MTIRGRWFLRTLVRTLGAGTVLLCGPLLLVYTVRGVGYNLLYDFRGGLFNAGRAILHGHSPYLPGFLAHQAALMRAGHVALGETAAHPFSIPVYPAIANLLVVPFSLLPFWVAGVIYSLVSVAAMLGGIWLLGVRDWRCLALVLFSWPFLFGVFLGAVGPFLVLGTGAAWHWRERIWPAALAVASIIAAKVFPWPLAVWLLITRRYRAFGATAVAGVVLTFGAWAVIGFHGLAQYPQMLSEISFLQENRAVSVVAIMVVAGIPSGVASAIAIALGAGILFAAWRVAHGPDGDRRALGLAVLAALTATPIVWEHYMVLLFVPIALASPRLSTAWLIPLSAPLFEVAIDAIAGPHSNRPFSADTLGTAAMWLVLQALTAVVLCTSTEQRGAFRARLRPRPRVADVPAFSRLGTDAGS